MACGMIAMRNAGVDVEEYDAYEIDKYAVQTATHNFPVIKEHGDVFKADFTKHKGVDFLIGGSPCFTAEHLVLTDKGYKRISDIQVGDNVLTHTGNYRQVIRTYTRESPTFTLKVQGYTPFTTTENHPFYAIKRTETDADDVIPDWVAVKDLNTDYLCGRHITSVKQTDTHGIDTEKAYMLGRYVADRYIPAGYMGFIKPFGLCFDAYERPIPEIVYNLPKDLQEAFIAGFKSGIGCSAYIQNKSCFITVSLKVAVGLQRLLTNLYSTDVEIQVMPSTRTQSVSGTLVNMGDTLYVITVRDTKNGEYKPYIQNGIIWSDVEYVQPTGNTEKVYNIEVAKDNSYTVNNCIVHNCTYWSIAKGTNRETTASGMGWELFSQYVRALKEAEPSYFIYENNKSMSKDVRNSICEAFGFEPVCINSALVSAQNRQRLYWVGVRQPDGTYRKADIKQPDDRGVLITEVLDTPESVCMRYERSEKAKQLRKAYEAHEIKHKYHEFHEIHPRLDGKTNTLTTVGKDNPILQPVCVASRGRNPDNPSSRVSGEYLEQRFEAHTDGKTNTLTTVSKDNLVAIPINTTVNGKSGCIRATCYKDGIRNIVANDVDKRTGVAQKVKNLNSDELNKNEYIVKNGMITVKGSSYPIKLPDGVYLIRPLSVDESKRLQTIPDWFEFPVSKTQALKQLGNGWTVEVIVHLIKSVLRNESKGITQ